MDHEIKFGQTDKLSRRQEQKVIKWHLGNKRYFCVSPEKHINLHKTEYCSLIVIQHQSGECSGNVLKVSVFSYIPVHTVFCTYYLVRIEDTLTAYFQDVHSLYSFTQNMCTCFILCLRFKSRLYLRFAIRKLMEHF